MPIVDCIALGRSLSDAQTRAKTFMCVNGDTMQWNTHYLFAKYWDIMLLTHLNIPPALRGTEMERLKRVYRKLQVFKLFDQRDKVQSDRVC